MEIMHLLASTLDIEGSISDQIVETTSTSNYVLDASDYTVIYKHTTGNPTMTLPAANTCEGRAYIIIRTIIKSHCNNWLWTL